VNGISPLVSLGGSWAGRTEAGRQLADDQLGTARTMASTGAVTSLSTVDQIKVQPPMGRDEPAPVA
jgi:hypothetical protein